MQLTLFIHLSVLIVINSGKGLGSLLFKKGLNCLIHMTSAFN